MSILYGHVCKSQWAWVGQEEGVLPASLSIHSLTALVAMLYERERLDPSSVLWKAADLQKHS